MVPVFKLKIRGGEVEFVVVLGRLYDARVKLQFPVACFLGIGGKVVWCVWVERKRV